MNARRQRFVAEYLVDLNATQAAIRAGYSARTADRAGSQLLSFPEVRAAVDAALARRAERVEVRQDDVLRELMRIAFVDIAEAFDADGNLRPIREIPEDVRRAIAGVDVVELPEGGGTVKKLKLLVKTDALDKLMRHLGAYRDRVEVEVKSYTDLLAEARALALARRGG